MGPAPAQEVGRAQHGWVHVGPAPAQEVGRAQHGWVHVGPAPVQEVVRAQHGWVHVGPAPAQVVGIQLYRPCRFIPKVSEYSKEVGGNGCQRLSTSGYF